MFYGARTYGVNYANNVSCLPVTIRRPVLKTRPVHFGFCNRNISALNLRGLYSALRVDMAISRRSTSRPRWTDATMFWTTGIPLQEAARSSNKYQPQPTCKAIIHETCVFGDVLDYIVTINALSCVEQHHLAVVINVVLLCHISFINDRQLILSVQGSG